MIIDTVRLSLIRLPLGQSSLAAIVRWLDFRKWPWLIRAKLIRLEKHLQCEKLLGLAKGTTKKRGNKKSDESITPIRYNVNHMYL